MQYSIELNGRTRRVSVHHADGRLVVLLDGTEWPTDAVRVDAHLVSLLLGSASHELSLATDPVSRDLTITARGVPMSAVVNGRRRWGRKDEGDAGSGPQRIVAPMPGKVVRVLAKVGDIVQPRQSLVVIEAMKMENELRASRPGSIAEIHAVEGQSVDAGALLMVVRPA